MSNRIIASLVVALVAASGNEAVAQSSDPSGKGEPTGVRESARLLDVPTVALIRQRAVQAAPPPKWVLLAVPTFTWADGLRLGGANVGVIATQLPRPVQVRAGFRHLDVEGGDDRTQFIIDGKSPVVSTPAGTAITLVGEYRRTVDVSRQYRVGGSLEQSIGALTLAGNLEYVNARRGTAAAIGDVAPSVGVSYGWANTLQTSFDYAFTNDVDADDDYSFTMAHTMVNENADGRGRGNVTFVFGVTRDRTVYTSVVVPFRR
jgi:hypothetical protein